MKEQTELGQSHSGDSYPNSGGRNGALISRCCSFRSVFLPSARVNVSPPQKTDGPCGGTETDPITRPVDPNSAGVKQKSWEDEMSGPPHRMGCHVANGGKSFPQTAVSIGVVAPSVPGVVAI